MYVDFGRGCYFHFRYATAIQHLIPLLQLFREQNRYNMMAFFFHA
jgi:hypothetical protein